MKLNPLNVVIAILISLLLAYALWSFDGALKNYVAIGAFVFFACTLVPCLAHSDGVTRRLLNLRVVATVFFLIGLAINAIFSFVSNSGTTYVVINGLSFLVYVFVANNVYTARQ